MVQAISKFIYTKILGWKLNGDFPKELKKYIIIGAPHTSWKDFHIALLARNSWGTQINFIGKKSIFKWPWGFFVRAFGGSPVDRTKSINLVDAIVQLFDSKEEFRLALSPEGTRQYVEKWKTGFYYIAKGANIPIVMFAFDFGKKEIKLSEPFYPTDNIENDFKVFLDYYKDIVGAKPELFNNKRII